MNLITIKNNSKSELKQKLFQEDDAQIKQMILSRAEQKSYDKMLEKAHEITDVLDAKKDM